MIRQLRPFVVALLLLGSLLLPVRSAWAGEAAPRDLYATAGSVQVFPNPPASGDLLSLKIVAYNGGAGPVQNVGATIYHRRDGTDKRLTTANISFVPAGGTGDTVLEWTWDTLGLSGPQTLVVQLDPADVIQQGDENAANNVAQAVIDLGPPEPDEEGVQWRTVETECCRLHYMTNTPAERDLPWLIAEANAAVAFVEAELEAKLPRKFEVYLVPRTLGHGGFAMGYLVISYHDRHYPAGRVREVLRHEVTHALQRTWASGEGITMMSEGLAVWVTGGHFKPEPVRSRAAALLTTGLYIPFESLVDDFYSKQHEISYLQAAGFVLFLTETYGEDKLREVFANLNRGQRRERDLAVLDRALTKVLGKGVKELEGAYRAWLAQTSSDPAHARDLTNTVHFFDTVRRYQQAFDPAAYFRTAWMPNIEEAKRRELVADYIRHPETETNLALETLFLAAADAQYAGDYARMEEVLAVINDVLSRREAEPDRPVDIWFSHPLAFAHLVIARETQAAGYEVQRIDVVGDRAFIWATRHGSSTLHRLTATRRLGGWGLFEWVWKEAPWQPLASKIG